MLELHKDYLRKFLKSELAELVIATGWKKTAEIQDAIKYVSKAFDYEEGVCCLSMTVDKRVSDIVSVMLEYN